MWYAVFKDEDNKLFEIYPFKKAEEARSFIRTCEEQGYVMRRKFEPCLVNGKYAMVRQGMDLNDDTTAYYGYREDQR